MHIIIRHEKQQSVVCRQWQNGNERTLENGSLCNPWPHVFSSWSTVVNSVIANFRHPMICHNRRHQLRCQSRQR